MIVTLEKIAHFDRCLFPEDFSDQLIKNGINPFLAKQIRHFIFNERARGNHVGVIRVYQIFGIDGQNSQLREVIQRIVDNAALDGNGDV